MKGTLVADWQLDGRTLDGRSRISRGMDCLFNSFLRSAKNPLPLPRQARYI